MMFPTGCLVNDLEGGNFWEVVDKDYTICIFENCGSSPLESDLTDI